MSFIKYAKSKFKVEEIYSYRDLSNGIIKLAGKNVTASLKKKIASIPAIDAEPENYIYVRNRSVSALETYGANQNYDAFPSEELANKHASFLHCPVDIDHINETEHDVIGIVLDSVWVPKQLYSINDNTLYPFSEEKRVALLKQGKKLKIVGDYVENLLAIDKKRADRKSSGLVEAILKREITDTSMGTSVNESECSICGNVAHQESDYCEHIKCKVCGHEDEDCSHVNDKGRMISHAGRAPSLCYEINRGLDFFEDSIILSEKYAEKSGSYAKAGGEGADKSAKVLEVVASKQPTLLDSIKKRSNIANDMSDVVVIGEEPKELEEKREAYEETKEDSLKAKSIRLEDKDISITDLIALAKEQTDYNSFEKEVKMRVMSRRGFAPTKKLSTASTIKLKHWFNKYNKQRHQDEVLAHSKSILIKNPAISRDAFEEELTKLGFKQEDIEEALSYQINVKGNFQLQNKKDALKDYLVAGMKLYNSFEKESDLQGANYANELNTGLGQMSKRYTESQMDDTGHMNETVGDIAGKNYLFEEPVNDVIALKKLLSKLIKKADLKQEILTLVDGAGNEGMPESEIFGRFGATPEAQGALENLKNESKVTVDEFGKIHPVDFANNNSVEDTTEDIELDSQVSSSEMIEPEVTNEFKDFESFEKYMTSLRSKWVILTATDQNKTEDAQGNSIPAPLHPDNIYANEKLKADIAELGKKPIEIEGAYLGKSEGKSYLVDGASLQDGAYLGLKYNQESIFIPQGIYTLPKGVGGINSPNDVTEAILQRGELAPTIIEQHGEPVVYWGDTALEQDGYSVINIGGQDIAFSFGIDWNKTAPFESYLDKTAKLNLVEDEVKDTSDIKENAPMIKYTDDEDDLTKTNKTMIERLELKARRIRKEFEKTAGEGLNAKLTEVGEQFKVVSVSSNTNSFGLRGVVLLAQNGEAWQVGVSQLYVPKKGDIITTVKTPQGIRFGKLGAYEIPERLGSAPADVVKEVWTKTAGKNAEQWASQKMDINGIGIERYDSQYNKEEMDLSQGSGDPANYKDLKKNQDKEFTTDEKGMVQKVKSLRKSLGHFSEGNDPVVDAIFNLPFKHINQLFTEVTGKGNIYEQEGNHFLQEVERLAQDLRGNAEHYKKLLNDSYPTVAQALKTEGDGRIHDNPEDFPHDEPDYRDDPMSPIYSIKQTLSRLNELADERMIDTVENKDTLTDKIETKEETFGFENNDEILDTENVKGNLNEQLKKTKSALRKISFQVDSSDTEELRIWVLNNEGLYNWYMSETGDSDESENIDRFINENRQEITNVINKALGNKTANVMGGDSKPLHMDSLSGTSMEKENDQTDNADNSPMGVLARTLKQANRMFEDYDREKPEEDTQDGFDFSMKSDEQEAKEIEDRTAGLDLNVTAKPFTSLSDGTSVWQIVDSKGKQIATMNANSQEEAMNRYKNEHQSFVKNPWNRTANTVPYNINPNDQVEIKDSDTGATEQMGSVTNVKEEVNADGSTSPTVETTDGKMYSSDDHIIQKTQKKASLIAELENMEFGDSQKIEKMASLENLDLSDSIMDIHGDIVKTAIHDSTEEESLVSDNEASSVFSDDDEPIVRRNRTVQSAKDTGSGFTINTHGQLKERPAEMSLETMWD